MIVLPDTEATRVFLRMVLAAYRRQQAAQHEQQSV